MKADPTASITIQPDFTSLSLAKQTHGFHSGTAKYLYDTHCYQDRFFNAKCVT